MVVKQIILGSAPEHLKHCISSVMQWCVDRGIKYEQISSVPEQYGTPVDNSYLWYRNVSEHIN